LTVKHDVACDNIEGPVMAQNSTEKPITGKQIEAAELVALDTLSDEQIAAQLKIGRRTLAAWKKLPAFIAAKDAAIAAHAEAVRAEGIANKRNRMAALNARWQAFHQIVAERGADPAMQDVPGGSTGWVVKSYKMVGAGRDAQLVEEYSVDTGLAREMRETEKQGAQEVGDWTEKASVDQTTRVEFIGIDPEAL
jgi:hypothetical protein